MSLIIPHKFLILYININLLIQLTNQFQFPILNWNPEIPPPPPPSSLLSTIQQLDIIKSESLFKLWTPDSNTNIWEYSGLYEGDIMLNNQRNGLINQTLHWPNATVPFYIDRMDFNDTEIITILNSFQEYHMKSCIRFRPYTSTDNHWILIKGNNSGCWSNVGMHSSGQVVNIHAPNCVRHGVVLHELLHALGFYHQQSTTDRDEYVKINWENIADGREHNFQKYTINHISNYDVAYDYESVMHYSGNAFSKNGQPTIEALVENITLGQRKQMTSKDVKKLNRMYKCDEKPQSKSDEFMEFLNHLIQFFQKE